MVGELMQKSFLAHIVRDRQQKSLIEGDAALLQLPQPDQQCIIERFGIATWDCFSQRTSITLQYASQFSKPASTYNQPSTPSHPLGNGVAQPLILEIRKRTLALSIYKTQDTDLKHILYTYVQSIQSSDDLERIWTFDR